MTPVGWSEVAPTPQIQHTTFVMKTTRNRGKLWSRFFSQERFHGNVVLNFTRFPKGELAAYGRSYHEAAQHLVKHTASTHYRDPDACPIVFLYRHAVELYLKAIIHWGNSLLQLNGKPIAPHRNIFTEHRLRALLKSVKPILRFQKSLSNWDDSHFRCFRDVEKVIEELEEFDPGSYSFRYPIDTTGTKGTLPHHMLFNVIAFGEEFDHLITILSGISMMAYEDFQVQAAACHEHQQMVANGL
jgi:hypothetical protein